MKEKKSVKKEIKKDNSLIGYIFGIISIVLAFVLPIGGLIFGIIGLVQSKKEKNDLAKKAKNYNIIGIILSVVFMVASAIINYYLAQQTALLSGLY